MPITTVGIVSAVTPSVVETYVSHFLNRGQLREKPTAHISYHEGLRLVRQFLDYSSKHAVEDLQAFTAQWVPAPTWVKTEDVHIGNVYLDRAAKLLQDQLGPKGIEQVGGETWWQWRRPGSPLRAEWIEMKKDVAERKRAGGKLDRAMLYVHGGAYYFGSVDEHRYQIQRHARKLKTRVLAPRYRLAPQYPFPCGLQDAIASYLFLLDILQPSQILVAGDSAGAGMIVSMLVTLRDQNIPLPAGGILLSPWVDLTHSFPSVGGDGRGDYIPPHGFHHKPSLIWPPPNADELEELEQTKNVTATANLSVVVDGQKVELKEQIQMYATNALLTHPLVSPVQQPSLGGLPPLLIQVGGAELLHDEQVYLAHKAANPQRFRPSAAIVAEYGLNPDDITKYSPTHVQLQVWDDLCHVAHTLSFTRPAKYMFRSVAQFGAWALAHAQQKDVEIEDDANSIISSGGDTDNDPADASGSTVDLSRSKRRPKTATQDSTKARKRATGAVGRAGDPLPPFKDHMIRQRVDRHGITYLLTPVSEMTCLRLEASSIGIIKPALAKKWMAKRKDMDIKFANEKKKVQKRRLKEMALGTEVFPDGDQPPPTALAGRRRPDMPDEKRAKKSWALALWSSWGSHHDEETLERAESQEHVVLRPSSRQTSASTTLPAPGFLSPTHDIEDPGRGSTNSLLSIPQSNNHDGRPRSPYRKVSDVGQADEPMTTMHSAISPMLSPDEPASPEGSDNTFGRPGDRHNGAPYPFKLRNPMSSASTATFDDASSVPDTTTTRSTPAQSVAPVESLVAEKEVMMPYNEKEFVAMSAPYQRPSELAGSSRAMVSQASLQSPRSGAPDTYSPQNHASTPTSPIETHRPQENRVRNPAFDYTGAANSKFSGVDAQPFMGPPKPVGFAYNPRDLRNAMINRQVAETTMTGQAHSPIQGQNVAQQQNFTQYQTLTQHQNFAQQQNFTQQQNFSQPQRQQPTLSLSPTGYIAPVELPAMPHVSPSEQRPSGLAFNNDSDPVELSTVKQTRTSMLPPPRTEPPPTPTLELSAVKQTRNSVLPAPRTLPSERLVEDPAESLSERPESPTLRPSTMSSNESGSASVASSNGPREPAIKQNVVIPVVEPRRLVSTQTKAPLSSVDSDSSPPPPPPKDTQFAKASPQVNGTSKGLPLSRAGSKPPVIGDLSLGADLAVTEINGIGHSS